MSVAAGVRDAAMPVRGKIVQTKVKRYWSGKAPEWAAETVDLDLHLHRTFHAAPDTASPRLEDADATAVKDDHLLAETRALIREELPAGSRRIRQAEVVPTADEEEDEDVQDERQRRIRERHLLREREELEELLPQEGEEGDPAAEDEDESEYVTGSEDEGMVSTEIVKPVFLPKPLRDTIAEKERIEGDERRLKELVKKKMDKQLNLNGTNRSMDGSRLMTDDSLCTNSGTGVSGRCGEGTTVAAETADLRACREVVLVPPEYGMRKVILEADVVAAKMNSRAFNRSGTGAVDRPFTRSNGAFRILSA